MYAIIISLGRSTDIATLFVCCVQMSSKDATISSLQSTVSKLQRDCTHLEQLNSSGSTRGQVEPSRLGLDEGLELIRPSTGASSCVPYEAMGTLKMSSFTTLPTGKSIIHCTSRRNVAHICIVYMYI